MENNFNKFAPRGRTKLINGSILSPELPGLRLVIVPCSETGKPDTVLHRVLDKKWSVIGKQLKGWFAQHVDFKLGSIQTTAVQSDTWGVHMLCYDKNGQLNGLAVEACLKKISALAVAEKASVHFAANLLQLMPSLSDLVGPYLLNKGIHTYFYNDPALVEVATEVQHDEETGSMSPAVVVKAPVHVEPVVTPAKEKSAAKKSVSKSKTSKKVKKSHKTVIKSALTSSSAVVMSDSGASLVTPENDITVSANDSFLDDLQKLDE